MQDWSFALLILLALGWGIRHAFDADPVMIVTGFGQPFKFAKSERLRHFLASCRHWLIDHGGILLRIAWILGVCSLCYELIMLLELS